VIKHLLTAQAHIPPTELTEAAGLRVHEDYVSRFDLFDDGLAPPCPNQTTLYAQRTDPAVVLQRLNDSSAIANFLGKALRCCESGAIDFAMVDKRLPNSNSRWSSRTRSGSVARGDSNAMTDSQKRGALLSFGKHNALAATPSGQANECSAISRIAASCSAVAPRRNRIQHVCSMSRTG